jgi:tetratricopeptide (TPR) repeat protein
MRSGMAVRIVVAAGFIAAAGSVSAQRQSQQPAPSPSPSPSPGSGGGSIPSNPTPGTPGRQPSPFPDSRQQQQQSQQDPFGTDVPRPIFLPGKVMLDDGTPAESVVIERVCNGNPRPEAYTDSKGHFSFQLGQNTAMMADASVGSMGDSGFGLPGQRSSRSSGPMGRGGVTEQQLMGCEIRAVLAGFRSDVVNLAGRRALDNPELGVIILHRMGNVEGTTISMTSLQAPKDAKKAYDKGREALKKNKVTDAEKELQKAVAAYPKYAIAWYELGRAQEAQNRVEDARKSYEQALAADAKYINPYLQLAGLSARDKKWQDVADTTARVIRLDPFDFPQAYFYNSVANYNLGKLDAAEKSAREAQKLDTQHRYPRISQLLGLILADRKDYVAAAQNMRDYLKFAPGAQDAATVRGQLTELERLAGVVKLEQQP